MRVKNDMHGYEIGRRDQIGRSLLSAKTDLWVSPVLTSSMTVYEGPPVCESHFCPARLILKLAALCPQSDIKRPQTLTTPEGAYSTVRMLASKLSVFVDEQILSPSRMTIHDFINAKRIAFASFSKHTRVTGQLNHHRRE